LLLKHAAKLRLNRVSLTLHHSRNHNPTGRKKIPFEHHVPNRGLLFCMRLSTKVYNFASERSLRNTCGIDTRPASTLTLSPDFSAHRLINLRTFPGNHTRTLLPRNIVQGWLYNRFFFSFWFRKESPIRRASRPSVACSEVVAGGTPILTARRITRSTASSAVSPESVTGALIMWGSRGSDKWNWGSFTSLMFKRLKRLNEWQTLFSGEGNDGFN
jgi:hypothetical protein